MDGCVQSVYCDGENARCLLSPLYWVALQPPSTPTSGPSPPQLFVHCQVVLPLALPKALLFSASMQPPPWAILSALVQPPLVMGRLPSPQPWPSLLLLLWSTMWGTVFS